MASTDHSAVFPPLLNSTFPPQAAEPCSRIVTGSRCWLLSCVDVGNGYHFSQTINFNLIPAQNSSALPLNNHSSDTPSNSSVTIMMRIRHHMRSRRGVGRGRSIHPPAMPSPESSSPSSSPVLSHLHSSFSGRYPDTRNGRGWAQLQGVRRMDAAVHTTNFPLPPHPAPHTTQFLFHRLVITTTVTITFFEEIDP